MISDLWIRSAHRWLSLMFTGAFLLNLATMGEEEPNLWIGLLALLPLLLLLVTGLYLFFAPYLASWRQRAE